MLPNFLCSSNQPSTHPGTLTGNGPVDGIWVSPLFLNSANVSEYGDRPDPLSPYSFLVLLSQTMAKMSPPIPLTWGSTTPSIALAAIAASMAFPPARKISMPAWVLNGWEVQTIPFCAMTSLRPAQVLPDIRSWPEAETKIIIWHKLNRISFFIFKNLRIEFIQIILNTINKTLQVKDREDTLGVNK